jgi:hypothetical protein
VKSLVSLTIAGILLSGTVFVDRAEAGDKRKGYSRYENCGQERGGRHYRDDRYFRDRGFILDVAVLF